jgi:hypothetical protein
MSNQSRLDKLRQKQPGSTVVSDDDKPKGKIIPPKGGSGTAPPKDERVKNDITHVCGHTTKKGKPEEPCGPCKHAAEVAATRAANKKKPCVDKVKRLDDQMESGRLPGGAKFEAVYDAEKREWTGSLSIPGFETFRTTVSGVFRLMRKLDWLYRDTAASRENKVKLAAECGRHAEACAEGAREANREL